MDAGDRRPMPADADTMVGPSGEPLPQSGAQGVPGPDRLLLAGLAHRVFLSFRRRLEQRTIGHGVSANQWRFLRQLWRHNGISQRALADRLALSEATVAVTLRTLEERGLVDRRRNASNRRESLVFLTPSARDLEATLLPLARDVHLAATYGIAAAEVDELEALLRRVIANIDAAL